MSENGEITPIDNRKTNTEEGSSVKKKKYWRQIKRGPFYFEAEPGMTGTSVWAHHNEYGSGTTLGYHCISEPGYAADFTHSHDNHELLCFLGGDPTNINDFGAEISICLGEEMEEHIITSPAIVSIPPGLKHCPLVVKKCTKPIVFLEISTTAEYKATGTDGKRIDSDIP
jgi:uncharacterized RmlC-like cupin family protein